MLNTDVTESPTVAAADSQRVLHPQVYIKDALMNCMMSGTEMCTPRSTTQPYTIVAATSRKKKYAALTAVSAWHTRLNSKE